ncbi:hypothetical protein A2165_02455 [Candidatus Curtissbacteria bacterium RBG_13_40_7]|uniref:3-deoxy-D-manno-octulosonic acid transferase n=1 Tax=Candidatus Curtissbacteria bacterium RBG_13_40_7 TaxID=1797706 RepID=A0A1F5FYI4_9BACT|nr:MAG: hypothetical protein A2165_02455 [Candidatus Curtissbacteria bacterium RBG_13_40_7]
MTIPRKSKYRFFLDETGDHGLNFIDENFPIFLLAGCLFEEDDYSKVTKQLNNFKKEFFKTTEVILHSRDIRKCEGAFQVLFDLDLKKAFYENLNKIILGANFTIIAVAIDKKKHIEKYGKVADNPYSICLSYILERLIFCTDSLLASTVSIVIEKRGKRENKQLLSHYNSIIDRGTYHVSPDRFKNRFSDFEMITKKENIVGLQIADLCAYPVARHVLNSKEPYIPFKVIQDKLYKSSKGEISGHGLKVFP